MCLCIAAHSSVLYVSVQHVLTQCFATCYCVTLHVDVVTCLCMAVHVSVLMLSLCCSGPGTVCCTVAAHVSVLCLCVAVHVSVLTCLCVTVHVSVLCVSV